MRNHIVLALAIVDLSLGYSLYTNELYFNFPKMATVLGVAFIAMAALFLRDMKDKRMEGMLYVVLAIPALEAVYYIVRGTALLAELEFSLTVVALIYLSSRYILKDRKHRLLRPLLVIPLLSIITGVVAYAVLFNTHLVVGTSDEVAYNYYAASLFLSGQNPYTSSMEPIMGRMNMLPTALLNGSYEYAYDYPPLSMVAMLPVYLASPIGLVDFWYNALLLGIILCVLASFTLYYKSGYNSPVLVPIAAWLLTLGETPYHISQYLAVSLFLLVAYVKRDDHVFSGVLLGFAAGTTQLAWPALPFFYLLALREHGRGVVVREFAIGASVFLLIIGYFLVSAPSAAVRNMFAVFGETGFLPSGAALGELSVAFYALPTWYFTAIPAVAYMAALAIFYSDTRRFRVMLAVAPFIVYFLSLRNQPYYALPFIPLVIAMYYADKGATHAKPLGMLGPVLKISAFAVIVLLAAAPVLHGSYAQERLLSVGRVAAAPGGSDFNVTASVTNNYGANQTVSIMAITSNPFDEKDFGGQQAALIGAGKTFNVTIVFQQYGLTPNTEVTVIALSPSYIARNET